MINCLIPFMLACAFVGLATLIFWLLDRLKAHAKARAKAHARVLYGGTRWLRPPLRLSDAERQRKRWL
jgi:hypothetical protein